MVYIWCRTTNSILWVGNVQGKTRLKSIYAICIYIFNRCIIGSSLIVLIGRGRGGTIGTAFNDGRSIGHQHLCNKFKTRLLKLGKTSIHRYDSVIIASLVNYFIMNSPIML